MKYDLTSPCANCPFRKDRPFPLGEGRVEEIRDALVRSEFTCHKTTIDSDDGEQRVDGDNAQHCAGALIMLEKLELPSQMMRIMERIGLYDRTKLKMTAPVYDDFDEMIEGCARADGRSGTRAKRKRRSARRSQVV